MSCVKVLSVLALSFFAHCQARRLSQIAIAPAQTIPNAPLLTQQTQGITDFLQSNANYSIFLSIVESDPNYSSLLSGAWTKGVTNNTVIVPTNDAVTAGFEQLGALYNVPTNPGQYLALANSSGIGTNFTATPLNTALAQFMTAIVNSHIFSSPNNFYANASVLAATRQAPALLPSTYLLPTYASTVYNLGGASTTARLVFSQPTGLLLDEVVVPEVYAQQIGQNGTAQAEMYLYEVHGLFIASQVQQGAAAGGSVQTALTTIKSYISS